MNAYRRKWTPIAPDLAKARAWRDAIFSVWTSEGHAGSLSAAEDVDQALADLSEEDGGAAAERALRYVRARKAEHKSPMDVLNYVRKRIFDHYPPPPAGAADMLEVKRRSKEADALFWRYVQAGDVVSAARARALMRETRYQKPIFVRRDELPSAEELASLVKIERDGEDFKAWGRHLARRASDLIVWLDPKAFARWPHVPSRRPPLDDAGRLAEARREEEKSRSTEGAAA